MQSLQQLALWRGERDGFARGDVTHGDGVHAVALPGRRRAVGEHVPEVAVAPGAPNLRAAHPEGAVLVRGDRVRRDGSGEGGPAGPRFELLTRPEQRVTAAGTDVGSGCMSRDEAACKGTFRPAPA